MKLIDFLEFEPFNRLRAAVGTDRLGHFELFDPAIHLTGEERSVLAREGLSVERGHLGRLLDHTLCYKNSRVIVVHGGHFHPAACDNLPSQPLLQIATTLRPFAPQPGICAACLQRLGYQGYDEHKARKAGYNRRVLEQFSLDEFWRVHPAYPLKRDRELVKSLAADPVDDPARPAPEQVD